MAARRCRAANGRFKKCGTGGKRRTARKSTARKGKCLKWSKGRKRCLKRAKR
jgi:hypothetical protein